MVIAGVGGTGLITVGAIIGMAAHMEGVPCSILDNTGLARKGGGVTTHVRLGCDGATIHATRISEGRAQLVLGGDVIVATGAEVLSRAAPDRATAIVNSHRQPTSAHALDPEQAFPAAEGETLLRETFGDNNLILEDVTVLAERLLGDGIYANMFLLGMAFQQGAIPLDGQSLEQAIRLNGIAVDNNLRAFNWGRQTVEDPDSVRLAAGLGMDETNEETLEEVIGFREVYLTEYQNTALTEKYRRLVEQVKSAESDISGAPGPLSDAVARSYFKLLANKDEYEVARLLTHPDFLQGLKERFEGEARISFHLAPPFLAPPANTSGKRRFGAWIIPVLRVLSHLKGLRGTVLDPFGYSQERQHEQKLIREYELNIGQLLATLDRDNLATAVAIAGLPMDIRGFGHVRQQSMAEAAPRLASLLQNYDDQTKDAA